MIVTRDYNPPLTRLVDAARPDSMVALMLRLGVDELLTDAPRFRMQKQELAIILPMRKLVFAAAELGQLAQLGPRDWLKRVETLAAPPPPLKK